MKISWNLDGKPIVVIAIANDSENVSLSIATVHANQGLSLQGIILQLLDHVRILIHAWRRDNSEIRKIKVTGRPLVGTVSCFAKHYAHCHRHALIGQLREL